MDDPRWLRLITIGLVLAALAVGYFLLTGRFTSNSTTKKQATTAPSVAEQSPQPTTISSPIPTQTPAPMLSPVPTPANAYQKIVDRNKGGLQTLPKTGFPASMAVVFSLAAIISGLGLRKFPN